VRWLLDTNVVSEGMRPKPDQQVLRWIAELPADQLAISDVTLAELRYGAANALDRIRRDQFERWLTLISRLFGDRALSLTVEILTDWLTLARRLRARGRPQSAPDLLIASTARIHHLTVVTRNIRGFADTGLIVYDPWTDQTHRMDLP
jgi:predicted nucleic acid-binding protein